MLRKICCFIIVGLIFATVVKGEKKKSENKKTTTVKIPAQLQRDGILITNKAYKQIFQAYITSYHSTDNKKSVFITSDSLLNAYHILFEESIRKLEERQALFLEQLVNALYKELPVNPELYKVYACDNYFYRAKLILGIAVKLFNPEFKIKNKELNELVNTELTRINKAEGISMPKWLGKPSASFAGIDYSRFKVRSFYNKSESLKRYFQVAQWLQTVPFRVEKDVDLATFKILLNYWENITKGYSGEQFRKYFYIYDELLGKQSGIGINSFNKYTNFYNENGSNGFNDFRKKLLSLKKKDFINDKIHYTNTVKNKITEFRILPARETPSAILFSFTTDYRKSKQFFPDGLEVAAMLGSKFAMQQLSPEVRAIVKRNRNLIAPQIYMLYGVRKKAHSLYGRYLRTLKTLFDNKNKSLPYFMKTKSWEIKTCNTVLASWAQMRHTWALQTKINALFLGSGRKHPGFVEPSIEFWGNMAQLCESTKLHLERYDCFQYNPQKDLKLYKKLLNLFEKESSLRSILKTHPELSEVIKTVYWILLLVPADEDQEKYKKKRLDKFKEFVKALETNTLDQYPEIKEVLDENRYDLKDLWNKLQVTSLKLQAISFKQLNNLPLNDADKEFIENYGIILSEIMLYKGNSFLTPIDNAMRIIDVFSLFDENHIKYLKVGIGRAREILVLYPTPAGKVLCKGAIMPYYEFFSKNRLTDTRWKSMLDSNAQRPAIPKWLTPIVQSGKLKTAVIKRRY